MLVTGSRYATSDQHLPTIEWDLLNVRRALPGQLVVLRHGAARGVDLIAAEIAAGWGWELDPYPADWPNCGPDCPPSTRHRRNRGGWTYCPLAGPRRNRIMVDALPRPDVVVGFPDIDAEPGKSGTWDCLHYAAKAGLFLGGTRALTVEK